MAFEYYKGTLHLRDEHGLTARKEFVIGVDDVVFPALADRINAAAEALGRILSDFDNISDALITAATLTADVIALGAALKLEPGEQGVGEGAVVRIYKTNGDLHPYWIPGASETVFQADFATVDTGDNNLISFFEEWDSVGGIAVHFSDGERIDLAAGSMGMRDGYYATRPRSTKD